MDARERKKLGLTPSIQAWANEWAAMGNRKTAMSLILVSELGARVGQDLHVMVLQVFGSQKTRITKTHRITEQH